MATRIKPKAPVRVKMEKGAHEAPSSYFAPSADGDDKEDYRFFNSGAANADCALGGGWSGNRVINIVGDKSAGKTLLAIEAAANFVRQWPNGHVRYAEAEAAASRKYAEMQGMPANTEWNKDAKPLETIEDVYDDLKRVMAEQKGKPVLYILDSLDAISDEDEMVDADKDFNKGSYGAKKPKQISKMFRLLIDDLAAHPLCLMVISQIRDKIGVTFGETKTRSGGKALDFYSSQIAWVNTKEHLKRKIDGIEREIGVQVRIKVKKNKCGLPFREAEYPILFGYGIDDLTACVEWLIENQREKLLEEVDMSVKGYKVRIRNVIDKGGAGAHELRQKLREIIFREWAAIETSFLPKSRKYD